MHLSLARETIFTNKKTRFIPKMLFTNLHSFLLRLKMAGSLFRKPSLRKTSDFHLDPCRIRSENFPFSSLFFLSFQNQSQFFIGPKSGQPSLDWKLKIFAAAEKRKNKNEKNVWFELFAYGIGGDWREWFFPMTRDYFPAIVGDFRWISLSRIFNLYSPWFWHQT